MIQIVKKLSSKQLPIEILSLPEMVNLTSHCNVILLALFQAIYLQILMTITDFL